ncbi:EamA family transporter [Variovorax paradoxus]|uniref:EamA domain-containing protein n=1 Tax=Variovorax paradoxus TaxID=34073 RepID=A0A0H2LTI4_VARPD|nr:EamA family transporter [Variovorax paradoxus]KLN53494.1 hypothetical protein VPARA_53330 [Variovorax paradoxus]
MTKNASITGACMVIAAAALWGTTGTAQSFAPLNTSPYWIGTLRMLTATLFFVAFIGWRRHRGEHISLSMVPPTWRWVLIVSDHYVI